MKLFDASAAKWIGGLAIGAACIGLAFTMAMDTTLATERLGVDFTPTRVHNIGLMNHQHNLLTLFESLLISGVLSVGFGALVDNQEDGNQGPPPLPLR